MARIPAASLSNPDADLLAAQVASGQPVRFRLRLLTRVLPEAQSANVIGEVVGRESPQEIVLLGAGGARMGARAAAGRTRPPRGTVAP